MLTLMLRRFKDLKQHEFERAREARDAMPPIPTAAPPTAVFANGAAPPQPEIVHARMRECVIRLTFCCFLLLAPKVVPFICYCDVYEADDTTELTESADPSSVCYDYCETFTLSASALACLCLETGGDMDMMKMSANYSDIADQQSLATIVCQYKNWSYGNSPAYSMCYLDVCKDYSNNRAALCTTCSTSTTCTTPTSSTSDEYLKLVACTKIHLANFCATVH